MASLQQVYAAGNLATPHQAQGLTFESICRRKTALLTIGQAALEDAREFMDNRPCALFILDESACFLAAAAIRRPSTSWRRWGFRDGSYCAESIIGSCAFAGLHARAAGQNDGRGAF